MARALHAFDAPPRIVPAGDEAVLIELNRTIDRLVNRRVHRLAQLLYDEPGGGWLREIVPAYSSLLVYYDPDLIEYRQLFQRLRDAVTRVLDMDVRDAPAGRLVNIPVRYGGDDGPDLEWVADRLGMTPAEVVDAHSAPTYVVYMLGFTPGFCYLGDLPDTLAVERLATPRLALPAGAVAIGGRQTGIYSLENSPGGWRWIGRTETRLWNPGSDRPFLLQAGDEVRFVPV